MVIQGTSPRKSLRIRDVQRVLVDKIGGLQSASLLLLTSSLNKIKVLPDIGTKTSWLLAGERRFMPEITLNTAGDVRFCPEADTTCRPKFGLSPAITGGQAALVAVSCTLTT